MRGRRGARPPLLRHEFSRCLRRKDEGENQAFTLVYGASKLGGSRAVAACRVCYTGAMTLLRTLCYVLTGGMLLTLASAASAQKQTKPLCRSGEITDPRSSKCAKKVVCGPDQEEVLNRCFPKCPDGMKITNEGKCTGCRTGEIPDPRGGKCVKQVVCGPDQEEVLNRCFPKCPDGMKITTEGKCTGCRTGEIPDPRAGKCVKQVVCGSDQEDVLNKCLPKCPEGAQRDSKGGCKKPGARSKG